MTQKNTSNQIAEKYKAKIKRMFLSIRNNTDRKQSKNKIAQHQGNAAQRTANWTIGLVLVGIATAIILSFQLYEMSKDARIDQRAWVSVTDIETQRNGTNIIGFIITAKNTGKTPALQTHEGYQICLDPGGADEAFIFLHYVEDIPNKTKDFGIIAPGESFKELCTIEMSPMGTAINSNIALCGIISYRDIYGIDHWTEFCRTPTSDFLNFYIHGKHNNVDDKQE